MSEARTTPVSDRAAIVVTGAGGFIGRHLVKHLTRTTDDNATTPPIVGVSRREIDLGNVNAVQQLFTRIRPRVIVHLAASLKRRETPDATDEQWRDTFQAGRNVIEAAVRSGAERLLIAGSLEELESRSGILDITVESRPTTTYGLCKNLLRMVAAYHAARASTVIDWFRPFVVYGPGQEGEMMVPYAFRCASTGVPGDFSDGTQQRDFLYVDDLVEWLAHTIGQPVMAESPGQLRVHHLGSGVATPVRDAINEIGALFPGSMLRLGTYPRRPGEPEVQVAPEPLCPTTTPLREGLRKTAEWWRTKATGSGEES